MVILKFTFNYLGLLINLKMYPALLLFFALYFLCDRGQGYRPLAYQMSIAYNVTGAGRCGTGRCGTVSCRTLPDLMNIFLEIFFNVTWPCNAYSLHHILKFCDKQKTKINISDPALVILGVGDGYLVPISNILTIDKTSCNFFKEFFLKFFFYAIWIYNACSLQHTLKFCNKQKIKIKKSDPASVSRTY